MFDFSQGNRYVNFQFSDVQLCGLFDAASNDKLVFPVVMDCVMSRNLKQSALRRNRWQSNQFIWFKSALLEVSNRINQFLSISGSWQYTAPGEDSENMKHRPFFCDNSVQDSKQLLVDLLRRIRHSSRPAMTDGSRINLTRGAIPARKIDSWERCRFGKCTSWIVCKFCQIHNKHKMWNRS